MKTRRWFFGVLGGSAGAVIAPKIPIATSPSTIATSGITPITPEWMALYKNIWRQTAANNQLINRMVAAGNFKEAPDRSLSDILDGDGEYDD